MQGITLRFSVMSGLKTDIWTCARVEKHQMQKNRVMPRHGLLMPRHAQFPYKFPRATCRDMPSLCRGMRSGAKIHIFNSCRSMPNHTAAWPEKPEIKKPSDSLSSLHLPTLFSHIKKPQIPKSLILSTLTKFHKNLFKSLPIPSNLVS